MSDTREFHLVDFVSWANHELLVAFPLASLEICEPNSNPAAFIELDTAKYMSRLTFWESGSVHCEIIDIKTGSHEWSEHTSVKTPMDLLAVSETLLRRLSLKA
jgi:hypothetical protein